MIVKNRFVWFGIAFLFAVVVGVLLPKPRTPRNREHAVAEIVSILKSDDWSDLATYLESAELAKYKLTEQQARRFFQDFLRKELGKLEVQTSYNGYYHSIRAIEPGQRFASLEWTVMNYPQWSGSTLYMGLNTSLSGVAARRWRKANPEQNRNPKGRELLPVWSSLTKELRILKIF
jgi:hypothetical protein